MSIINLGLLQLTPGGGLVINGNTLSVVTADSVTIAGNAVQLVNDQATPPISSYYGTNVAGVLGYYAVSSAAALTGASGILASSIQATGQTLYGYIVGLSGAVALTYATQANLQSTGQTLYALITGISGFDTSQFATVANLGITGSTLYQDIVSLSGTAASSTALSNTGSNLYIDLTGMSGALNTQITNTGSVVLAAVAVLYATKTNLTITGQQLLSGISGLSGYDASTYATQINLQNTGQTLYNDITGLSGQFNTRLATTGATLIALIAASQGGVSSINGLSGALTFASSGFITYATGAGTITLGVTGLATTNNLLTTGQALYSDMVGLSGQANGAITSLSGQVNTALGATGSQLYNEIVTVSGNANGFYNIVTGMSGQANTNYATVVGLSSLSGQSVLTGVFNTIASGLTINANNTPARVGGVFFTQLGYPRNSGNHYTHMFSGNIPANTFVNNGDMVQMKCAFIMSLDPTASQRSWFITMDNGATSIASTTLNYNSSDQIAIFDTSLVMNTTGTLLYNSTCSNAVASVNTNPSAGGIISGANLAFPTNSAHNITIDYQGNSTVLTGTATGLYMKLFYWPA